MSALELGLALWVAVALAYRVVALRSLARQCVPAHPGAPPRAALVALRPLRGAGAATAECLESLLLAAEAGGARVVVGVEDPADPAAALAREACAARPGGRCEARIGRGPAGANRKVANLVQMAAGRKADVWLLTDGDVRVPPDYVAHATAPFAAPDVGLATGPYRSVPGRSLASRLDALLTNAHFLPSVCVASRFEGVHFALGANIAVRGEALERAGGFEALLDLPADDYALAQRVERAGYRLAWVPLLVDHRLEDEGWRAALRRHVRWARAARSVRPRGYAGQISVQGALPVLALAALDAAAMGPFLALPLAWWGGVGALLWRERLRLGLRARDLPWIPLVDLLAAAVWAAGLVGRPQPPDA